jgi:hypothetical protein
MAFNQSPAIMLATQDHMRNILAKSGETNPQKFKKFAPQNSHSPFGDFPDGFAVPKK